MSCQYCQTNNLNQDRIIKIKYNNKKILFIEINNIASSLYPNDPEWYHLYDEPNLGINHIIRTPENKQLNIHSTIKINFCPFCGEKLDYSYNGKLDINQKGSNT